MTSNAMRITEVLIHWWTAVPERSSWACTLMDIRTLPENADQGAKDMSTDLAQAASDYFNSLPIEQRRKLHPLLRIVVAQAWLKLLPRCVLLSARWTIVFEISELRRCASQPIRRGSNDRHRSKDMGCRARR